MRNYLAILGVAALWSSLACGATAQTYKRLEQPTDTALAAHINGTIFRVTRARDLPNALGRADIFGGKVDAGFLELRFAGLDEEGRMVLRLTDIEIHSNETTMSRRGSGFATGSAITTATSQGTWTTATGVYIPPRGATTHVLPPNTVEFHYNIGAGPLVIGDVEIAFLEASEYNVTYRLRSVPSAGR